MAAIVGGLCMEGLWRGWRFAMIGMKKLQDISDVACILSSNGNARVLLTFKKRSGYSSVTGQVLLEAIRPTLKLRLFSR